MFFPSGVAAATVGILEASADPPSLSILGAALPLTTPTTTVTATGGYPPYSFAWQKIVGTLTSQANAPTSATTSFTATGGLASGEQETETWRCAVTDNLGFKVEVDVDVTFEVSP